MRPTPLNQRGLTLIELMIVVAIVGVLATIASVSFTKYVTASKVTEMKQWAMDIARGQEQYFSRNGKYLEPKADWSKSISDTNKKEWTHLLEFNATTPDHITIIVEADVGGQDCAICAGSNPAVDSGEPWFAVRIVNTEIERDVLLTSDGAPPIELNVNFEDKGGGGGD